MKVKNLKFFMNNIQFQDFGTQNNWINGRYLSSNSSNTIAVISPYYDKEIATVPESNFSDLDDAVQGAKKAFPDWASKNIRDRAEVMFNLKSIMQKNLEELAYLIALDNGKTVADAKGSILRGKEVVEFATSLPSVLRGDSSPVGAGVTCTMTHEPLGVVAGITPFNFPAMVPLWMIPLAITTGNCFILKPSEQTPLSALKIAEYLKEAGLPDGVFSVINGSRVAVEGICDLPDILFTEIIFIIALGSTGHIPGGIIDRVFNRNYRQSFIPIGQAGIIDTKRINRC